MDVSASFPTGFAAPFVRVLIDYLLSQDIDTAPVLHVLGLHSADLDDINRRVPSAQLAQALHVCSALCQDDHAVIRIAQMVRPSHLGSLGYALITSPSFVDAVALYDRVQRLLCDEMHVHQHVQEDTVELVCEELSPMSRDTLLWSFMVSARLSFSRWLLGRHMVPLSVALPCPAPADPRPLLAHVGCRIEFDAPCARELISRRWLTMPNPNADPQFHQVMASWVDRDWTHKQASAEDLTARLRQLVLQHLGKGHAPSLEQLLPELQGMGFQSVRQLQRRLSELQLSYTDLLDNTRKAQVLHELQHTDLPLNQIAERAAYAEMASLHRAVKRWTGQTPTDWRTSQRLAQKKPPNNAGVQKHWGG